MNRASENHRGGDAFPSPTREEGKATVRLLSTKIYAFKWKGGVGARSVASAAFAATAS
jgi:hypothetical protein